jgi:hypothetical protein
MPKVINPRSTAKIPIKGFNFAVFGNLLSKFLNTKIMREVSVWEVTIVIDFSLRALNSDDEWFDFLQQVVGHDPFQEKN